MKAVCLLVLLSFIPKLFTRLSNVGTTHTPDPRMTEIRG